MGFFDKMMFWKKEPEMKMDFDDLTLPGEPGAGMGKPQTDFSDFNADFAGGPGGGSSYGGTGGLGGQGFNAGGGRSPSQGMGGGMNQNPMGASGGFGQGQSGGFGQGSDTRAINRFNQVQAESYNPQQSFQQHTSQPLFSQSSQSSQDIISSKNYEVMLSKLDALSAQIESVNQRLKNIERIALDEENKRQRSW